MRALSVVILCRPPSLRGLPEKTRGVLASSQRRWRNASVYDLSQVEVVTLAEAISIGMDGDLRDAISTDAASAVDGFSTAL